MGTRVSVRLSSWAPGPRTPASRWETASASSGSRPSVGTVVCIRHTHAHTLTHSAYSTDGACVNLFPSLTHHPAPAACLTGHDAVCFTQKISGYYVSFPTRPPKVGSACPASLPTCSDPATLHMFSGPAPSSNMSPARPPM